MKDIRSLKDRKLVLPDDIVGCVCEDQYDQRCTSIAYIELGFRSEPGVSTKTENIEAVDLTDSILKPVLDRFNDDNKFIDLFDCIESNLDVSIEDLSAAHLSSLIWSILSMFRISDMGICADDAADFLKKRIIQAIRQALIEIYEGDVDA